MIVISNTGNMEDLLKSSDGTAAGMHRCILQELVKSGSIYRYGRGLYVRSDAWEDEFYLLQLKYRCGIYSHDTALYLLGYAYRLPVNHTMTFPRGYNTVSLKQEHIIIKHVVPENYALGITEIPSPGGNPIRVYDIERTLCDILRSRDSDVQIITSAMKHYATSQKKDMAKLIQYANQLHVKHKVLRYLEMF